MRAGIYEWFGYKIDYKQRYEMIKDAGFYSIIMGWGDNYLDDKGNALLPDLAREAGLFIKNIHGPFEKAYDIWNDNLAGSDLTDLYRQYIKECRNHTIDTMVIHVPVRKNQSPNVELGLKRLCSLVDIATVNNVKIAVENLRRLEYISIILDHIKSENMGFCFDSGHENFHMKGAGLLKCYKDRVMAVHIHDNDGTGDQHRIPGEGTIDWSEIKNDLADSSYAGSITMEVLNSKSIRYKKSSAEEFLKDAFDKVHQYFT